MNDASASSPSGQDDMAAYRLLIEDWSQATWEADAAGIVVADSPSWRAYTGQTLEEWLGYGWLDAIHPDDQPYAEQQWQEATAAHTMVNAELRLRSPDGGWRWTNMRAAPVRGAEGRIEKWVGLNIDIDARKRAEEALRQSEGRLQLALEATSLAIYEWDLVSDQLTTNERFRELVGIEPGEPVVGANVMEYCVHRDDRARVDPALAHAMDSNGDGKFVFDHRLSRLGPLGNPWVLSHGQVYFGGPDGNRQPVRVVGTLQDITGRKQAEIAARQSEERQAFLLKFSDTLRAEPDADAIAGRAISLLSSHLGLDRCYITYYRPDDDIADFPYQVGNATVPPLPATVRLSDFPDAYEQVLDRTFIIEDDFERRGLSEAERANSAALGMRAMVASTVRQGEKRPLASLAAVCSRPRKWTAGEVALVEEVAERTWSAMERARAETAQRESEERFRQFAQASASGLWIRDAATLAMEYVSPAIGAIYGMASENLLGDVSRWAEVIVPECRAVARQHLEEARNGETVVHEFRIRRPSDQAIRWIRNTDFPLFDGEYIQRIGGIAEDITDAKLIQQKLAHSDERLRSAVEVGQVGLWDWNIRTGDVHWSDEHFQMQGYAAGEVAPSYEAWASRLHADDRAGAETALRQAMTDHQEYVREFRVVHPNGSIHWHSARGRFSYDDCGKAIRMIGAVVDITERREWEERQKVLVAELQHRTRNLMGVVRSMSDKTARASADLPDFRARFRTRLEALSRVQGLLSRLEDHDRVTFDDLIRTELAVMDGTADRVTLSGPDGIRLRSSTVQTLAMALHELTTNAMKYGALGQPTGRLTITWSIKPDGDGGKPRLHIDWLESGVAMALPGAAPRGTGQGRELIEKALPYQLKAETSYMLGPDGVHCTISVPVSASLEEVEDRG